MAGIHAQYYTKVQSVLNTPKIIPYLNQGTQKIPAKISFAQKIPAQKISTSQTGLRLSQFQVCPPPPPMSSAFVGHLLPHVVLPLININERTIH